MAKLSPKVEEFLKGKHIGEIATSMKDGSPHLTPIWYMLEDGKLIINTTTKRVKYHNIERDNRVCLLVEDGYQHVIVFGKARIAKERDGKKDIETLAIRYTGEEQGKKSARNIYWKQPRATIEITPERVVDAL
jgi:PPOX class probable F420-dependent enzyme